MITMTDGSGATQTVLTNPFGYYRFKDVPTGAIYVFDVRSKQYTFAPKILSIVEDMNDLDFVANP